MFIDTHCHISRDYCKNTDEVIRNAKSAGVEFLICPTAEPEDIQPTLNLVKKYDNVFCTIGIHPEYAGINAYDFILDDILEQDKVLGVGEIGLDYHENDTNKKQQIELFEQQLFLAKKHNLPVAIHTREAEEDTARILTSADYFGVMHCFTSSWNLAKTMLDRGFYFSASGILTFKNAEEVRETFAKIPLDKIVIETDSPYCAPVPYRGKVCEPAMVVETAKVLANLKGVSIEELETILARNTKNLYPKIKL